MHIFTDERKDPRQRIGSSFADPDDIAQKSLTRTEQENIATDVREMSDTRGPWTSALASIADRPHEAEHVLLIEDTLVAVRDKFPKSMYHVLLIARDAAIDSIEQVYFFSLHLETQSHMLNRTLQYR